MDAKTLQQAAQEAADQIQGLSMAAVFNDGPRRLFPSTMCLGTAPTGCTSRVRSVCVGRAASAGASSSPSSSRGRISSTA